MIIARRLGLSIFLLGWIAGCSGEDEPAGEGPGQEELGYDPAKLEAPDDVGGIPEDAEIDGNTGLAWRVLVEGTGTAYPRLNDRVRVDYVGWQTDGNRFDSSYERGRPAEFDVRGVIDGWVYGLQKMVEGEERRLWIPANLAYEGSPDKPQGMLVFDVVLLEILTQ